MRQPALRDAAMLADGVGHLSVARWLGQVPYPYRLADAEAYVASVAGSRVHWLALQDDTVIGGISADGELGYWLRRDRWGQGLATEMIGAVLNHRFARGETQIDALVHVGNDRSAHMLDRLGFAAHGIASTPAHAMGQDVPAVTMRMTADRWRARAPA